MPALPSPGTATLNGSRRAARRAMTFAAMARIGARGAGGTVIWRPRPDAVAGDATADVACLPARSSSSDPTADQPLCSKRRPYRSACTGPVTGDASALLRQANFRPQDRNALRAGARAGSGSSFASPATAELVTSLYHASVTATPQVTVPL